MIFCNKKLTFKKIYSGIISNELLNKIIEEIEKIRELEELKNLENLIELKVLKVENIVINFKKNIIEN